MFHIPWYSILLMTIPQIFLIIKVGMRLFNLKINNRSCLLISILAGCTVYFLRNVPITPGIHTVVTALIITLLVVAFDKINIGSALVSILLGFIIFGVIEGAWLPVFLKITLSSINDLELHPWLNIIGFYPILAVTIIIDVIIKSKNIILFDLQRLGPTNEKE